MMNVSMWLKALRVIPRLEKDEWQELDIISRWLITVRAAVLVITLISATIAGILTLREGEFDLLRWLLLTFGLVMAHATNNIVNDLTDSWKGVDKGDDAFRAQYGPQTIEHGLLTVRKALAYAAITGLIALAAGITLALLQGGLTWLLIGLGSFFILLYTWPLKHIGLGELAVLIVWGPLMIGGGYYVITGTWSWQVVMGGLPYALGATTVIFGKHIDKLKTDRAKKVRTLPVLIGERLSRNVAVLLFIFQYILVIALVIAGYFTPVMLAVLLALPTLNSVIKVYRQPRPDGPPPDYPEGGWPLWFVGFAFIHNRRFGFLYLLALLVDAILKNTLLL